MSTENKESFAGEQTEERELGIINQWKAGVPQSRFDILTKTWIILLLHPCAGNRSGGKFQGLGFNHARDEVGIIHGFICHGILFWVFFSSMFLRGEMRGSWDTFWSNGSCLDPRSFQAGSTRFPTRIQGINIPPLFFPVFPPFLLILPGSKAHSRCFGDNLELNPVWNIPDQLPAPSLCPHRSSSFPYLGALPLFPPFPLFSLAPHFPMPLETHSCTFWEEPSAATSNWGC